MKRVLPNWQISRSKVQLVTTLVLLRERAKTLRASYKKHWEVMRNITPTKVMFTSSEGTGDAVDRQERWLAYTEDHLPLIERFANRIHLSKEASVRWKNANRSRGSLRRDC